MGMIFIYSYLQETYLLSLGNFKTYHFKRFIYMGKKMLMQGNQAVAEATLVAGVKVCAGYPITPSSETIEVLARKMPSHGGRFIQMEDEIASIGVIIGASAAGKKAITATSDPGFSLMQELLGYAAMVELPTLNGFGIFIAICSNEMIISP